MVHEQFQLCLHCSSSNISITKLSNVTIVEKLFTCSGHMRRHIKTVHEGCKDFKCESCEKLFTQADSLRGHIKSIHEFQM